MEQGPSGRNDLPGLEHKIFSENALEEVRQELIAMGYDLESVEQWLSRHRLQENELPETDSS